MKAIILAGGEGKRLRPLTLVKPKPLIEVLGKPILHHIWDILPKEISEVILVVGYKKEAIKQYFGEEFEGRKITYVIQEEALGTGHALDLCKKYIGSKERFLFLFADDLHSAKALKGLLQWELGMLVHEHATPSRFGVVEVDENDEVISFEEKPEKPKSNLVSPGVFVLDGRIFNYKPTLHEKGEYFLTDMVHRFMKDERFIIEKTDFWHPIGYPEDVDSAEKIIQKEPKNFSTPIVIIAGGRGTRMPENEKHVNKILVEVAGKPMLEHQIINAYKQGFKNIRLSLGHKAKEVIQWIKENHPEITYVVESEPLGTGGGIKLAASEYTEPFIAINGDNLADFSYVSLLRHSSDGAHGVLSGVELEDARDFGFMECDENKKICAFREKDSVKRSGIISAGAYVLRPEDIADTPDAFSIEKDVFPRLAEEGKLVLAKHIGNYWFDCGTPERLEAVRDYFAKNHA